MKAGDKEPILFSIAGVFMLVGVFSKSLGVPEDLHIFVLLPAFVCFGLVFIQRRKIKKERAAGRIPPAPPAGPLAARKRVFWIVAASFLAGSITVLPLLPYTVENFHYWLYYYVVPFQILFVGGFLCFFWRKLVNPDGRTQR